MWRNKHQYLASNYNSPNSALGLLQAFAITSDPQYPWTDCSNREGAFTNCNNPVVSPCSSSNLGSESNSDLEHRSEALIREQYNNINDYMNSHSSIVNSAVLINGDMTAFGHGSEWNKIKSLAGILNRPCYFGLGNHDIINNFSNCANNGCFKNSLRELIKHVQGYNIPASQFDYSKSGSGSVYTHRGSFAYVVNLGGICFIQLQYDPTMNKVAEGTFWGDRDTYKIVPNLNWLENQLRIARDSGKIIIVNIHWDDKITENYRVLFQNYGVVAIFSGHFHQSYGRQGSVGNIPHFRSGSASQRTYLILEQYIDRLDIYAVSCNNWRNRQLVHRIPISTQLPIFSGYYQIVTALNNSSVLDLNDRDTLNNVTLWSNNGGNNQKWNFRYDQPRQSYQIYSVSNPNLVLAWNDSGGSRNVFATPFMGYDEHFWIIERGDNGFIFRNRKNSNLVLDVYNANTNLGTNIQVHERQPTGSGFRRAQEFQLIKMS
ncbi:RICIN domain-containing protein [Bacillus mycoides]|uniref:RICIN domain-containing protein n=1 Tax=Bacillus mycoides TaxID=1405 RepID=UPI001C023100|nr:RICIN domain-containing protein [Bacillus mycoides]QWI47137.1 hypothetical protein EXW55_30165 [Bacillus mycoides]